MAWSEECHTAVQCSTVHSELDGLANTQTSACAVVVVCCSLRPSPRPSWQASSHWCHIWLSWMAASLDAPHRRFDAMSVAQTTSQGARNVCIVEFQIWGFQHKAHVHELGGVVWNRCESVRRVLTRVG